MLDGVLKRIDDDLERSLERLFTLLRIESISTDPAYAPAVKKAADWLVGELSGLGFDASARSTPGHPIVVAHVTDGVGPRAWLERRASPRDRADRPAERRSAHRTTPRPDAVGDVSDDDGMTRR